MSATYTDPDSDAGFIHFTITDDDGNPVTSGDGTNPVASGQASTLGSLSLPSGHAYTVVAYAQDAFGAQSSTTNWTFTVDVAPQWSASPLGTPAANAVIPPQQPVLTASATDSDTPQLLYEFAVYSESTCTNLVSGTGADSDLLYDTASYTVPAGLLTEGQDYWWRARVEDPYGLSTGWSAECRKVTVRTPRFGVRDSWPMWDRGPLAVNLATGNLVVSLPGPSYDTGAGTIDVSLAYNSLDTRPPASGLPSNWPQGWTLVAGAAPPELFDHSQSGVANKFDAVELIWPDGDSDFYTHIGSSNAYQSPDGDLNVLSKDANGGFVLTGDDGTLYVYKQPASSGMADLDRVETSSTASGKAHIEYAFSSGKIASVSAFAKDAGGTDQQLAKLTFTWSCTGALLCIEGPDNAGTGTNVTWKYITDAYGRLYQVNDGTRVVAQIEYPGTGATDKPSSIKNANDLNPNAAGSAYSGSTGAPGYAHALQISYTGSQQVDTVVETDVRDRYYSPTRPDRTWDFNYTTNAGSCTSPSLPAAHTHTPAFTRRALAGCTDVVTPVHVAAGDGKKARVFYDVNANELASIDSAGNWTLSAYDDQGRLRWSEEKDDDSNVDGNPVDYVYDDIDGSLKSVTGPDPDSNGSGLARATTTYRYDEKDVGVDPDTAGTPLHGLRAYYFDNENFTGRPTLIKNEPSVDSSQNWCVSPPCAAGTGPPGLGKTNSFAVRWIGFLDASPGNYSIRTSANGGTRVIIDGVQIINKPAGQTTSQVVCNKKQRILADLSPGDHRHRIVVEYSIGSTGSAYIQLQKSTTSCTSGMAVVATSALLPGWLNRTSTVSPTNSSSGGNRLVFSHYSAPWTGQPDYTRQGDGTNTLITAFVYDDYGRLYQTIAPKGNDGRTFSGGDLSGSPNLDYATTLTYYAPSETASWSACSGALTNSPTVDNQRALLKSTQYAGIQARTVVYDRRGNPVLTTTAHGSTCRYFDGEDRLQEEKAPGETNITTFSYDPAGRVLQTNDGTGVTTAYNEAGEPIEGVDFYNAEIETSYDVNGNPTKRRVDTSTDLSNSLAGYATTYTYNDDDQLVTLTDPNSKQWKFFYDSRGNLKATTYPNNTFSWNDVLPTGWVEHTFNRDCSPTPCFTTLGSGPDADSTPLADFTYTYFENGQRASELRNGVSASSETTNYTYDIAGRLKTVTGPQPHTYCYDLDSNRTSIYGSSSATCGSGSPTSTYSYSTTKLDQLTSILTGSRQQDYGYTNDGEVSARGGDSLTWDGRGRDTGGTFDNLHGVQFTVDGSNQGTLDTVQPFQRSYDTSALSNGWHTFGATVTNEQGATTQAPTRVFTKNPDNGIGLIADLGSATSSGSANSVTLTVPAGAGTIPVGATVVIAAAQAGTTFSSAIDSAGNTYTIDKATTTNGGASAGLASARLTTALAPGATITARFGATATASRGMSAAAFQGLQTSTGWRDQVANSSGGGTGPLVNSGTTTVGGELIIGAVGVNSNATFTPAASWSGGGGFTKLTSATLSNLGVHLVYRVVTVRASYAVDGTLGSNQAWVAEAVTYKPSDGTAPATPTSVTATTTSPGHVSLTWSASSDANGISLYRVYRSTTSGFTPGTSNEVGQTTATSYTDDGDGVRPRLPTGTYYYKVVAEDTRGNASSASTQASVTVTQDETRPMVDLDLLTMGSQLTPLTGTITLAATASDPAPSGTISYTYDATGFRKSRTVNGATTRYLLGGLIETDASGIITKFDVDGPAGDLAQYAAAPSGTPTYLYYSAHGDVAAQDAGGTRTAFKYGPFGDLFTPETGSNSVERFTGQWDKKLDPTSGLIGMGARPYDPATGRFYATDPVVGGSCNVYDYACQDPVNSFDLDGSRKKRGKPSGIMGRLGGKIGTAIGKAIDAILSGLAGLPTGDAPRQPPLDPSRPPDTGSLIGKPPPRGKPPRGIRLPGDKKSQIILFPGVGGRLVISFRQGGSTEDQVIVFPRFPCRGVCLTPHGIVRK